MFHACATKTDSFTFFFLQACRELERSQDGAPAADFQAKPMGLGEALAKGIHLGKNRSSMFIFQMYLTYVELYKL